MLMSITEIPDTQAIGLAQMSNPTLDTESVSTLSSEIMTSEPHLPSLLLNALESNSSTH